MSEMGRPELTFKTKDSPWASEKEFVDFLESNIEKICQDILKSKYISHEREWYLGEAKRFAANTPRIDLMVKTDKGLVGIECKRPTQSFSELSRTISQILAYSCIAKRNHSELDRLLLFTTEHNIIVDMIIKEYNLPISVVVMGRLSRAEYIYEN